MGKNSVKITSVRLPHDEDQMQQEAIQKEEEAIQKEAREIFKLNGREHETFFPDNVKSGNMRITAILRNKKEKYLYEGYSPVIGEFMMERSLTEG